MKQAAFSIIVTSFAVLLQIVSSQHVQRRRIQVCDNYKFSYATCQQVASEQSSDGRQVCVQAGQFYVCGLVSSTFATTTSTTTVALAVTALESTITTAAFAAPASSIFVTITLPAVSSTGTTMVSTNKNSTAKISSILYMQVKSVPIVTKETQLAATTSTSIKTYAVTSYMALVPYHVPTTIAATTTSTATRTTKTATITTAMTTTATTAIDTATTITITSTITTTVELGGNCSEFNCEPLAMTDNPPDVSGESFSQGCVDLTNYARNHYNYGVNLLYWDDILATYAAASAAYSATNNCWDCHTNSGAGTSWGQNLFLGENSCQAAYAGWVTNEAAGKDSVNVAQGHFNNVVGFAAAYVSIGCGVASENGNVAVVCNYGL
ncbi:hypothetical protein HK100_009996 [Physocladia obscura]|uniref:SCP domain-containing protein n=1 Tax=Physocladia obscura TaxID=109957 RepID=A0AAD5XDZ5_9FUNG|nr:hypothetical protein HK100_009996 [Physocladia obscura]